MKKLAIGTVPILFLSAFDLAFRRHYVAQWSSAAWGTYLLSLAYVSLFAFVFWSLLALRLRAGWVPWLIAGAMGVLSALLYAGQYSYYGYFGIMPSVATYQYIFENADASWTNMEGSTNPAFLISFGAFALLLPLFWWMGRAGAVGTGPRTPARPNGRPWKTGAALLALTPVLYHNAALEQGTELPSAHALFSIANAIENELWTGAEQRKYMQVGHRTELPRLDREAPYNVVLIVNESVRADKLSIYGAKRDTTPRVKDFLKRHAAQSFLFDRFYSNSTTTRESYPSLLTGVHPLESFGKLHTMPLVFEYAKMFPNLFAFLVSSQPYDHDNLRLFVASQALDGRFDRESSGRARTSNEGIDDRWTVEAFNAYLDKVPAGGRFFAVVHMDTTHHPYWVPEGFRPFPGKKLLDRYENSLAYLDSHHGTLLDILEQRRLLDDTIVVFTSDHGEAFGEHGAFGHQQLFHEEGCRVPFWIYLPKPLAERHHAALEASRRALHSNLDIVPTLAGLLGLAQEPAVAALLKELRGQALIAPEAARGQPVLVYNGYTSTTTRKGFGLADGNFRFLVRPDPLAKDGFQVEAYDLAEDPLETRNLWGQVPPERVQGWLEALQDFPKLHDEIVDLIRPDRTVASRRTQ